MLLGGRGTQTWSQGTATEQRQPETKEYLKQGQGQAMVGASITMHAHERTRTHMHT